MPGCGPRAGPVCSGPSAGWYSVDSEDELRRPCARTVVQAPRGEVPATLLNPEVLTRQPSQACAPGGVAASNSCLVMKRPPWTSWLWMR